MCRRQCRRTSEGFINIISWDQYLRSLFEAGFLRQFTKPRFIHVDLPFIFLIPIRHFNWKCCTVMGNSEKRVKWAFVMNLLLYIEYWELAFMMIEQPVFKTNLSWLHHHNFCLMCKIPPKFWMFWVVQNCHQKQSFIIVQLNLDKMKASQNP